MGEKLSLNNICTGESVCVEFISTTESMERRLLDIGLTKGTKVICVGKSPMGDPAAFLIRGAVIALRCSDCESIIVHRAEAK